LKQVELAERLDVEPITACRIVDRLQEAGLVERQRDPDDRRAWRLELTPKAAPILEKLRVLAEEMSADAFAGLSPTEIEAMRTALRIIRENAMRAETAQKVSA
jgi:DNA-binding MarR family transcriptional regulator